jgi:two-component system, NtrC family, response regulator AtoC
MTKARIVLVDDELNLRRVLGAILHRDGYEVLEAADGEAALGLIGPGVSAVITDLRMPRMDGMALLRRVTADYPDIPVVMLTAHGSVDSAVEAVKLGAFDYIEKPFEQSQIRQVIDKAVRTHEQDRERPRALPTRSGDGRYGLVGRSSSLEQVFALIEKVAATPSTVLITGESGTGKELVARALHEHSARRDRPFIRINCAAIPKTLIESELFGYDKGAFTGAVSAKPGRFELADQGTLFLDEIGEIPVEMQVKLLRVLQESEFERVGGIKTLKVDVRLVAATNRELLREVQGGGFREDLYYRLNVVPIHLPPLRERKEDIPLLVSHFLQRFNERLKKHVEGLAPEAMERLVNHSWPGNIRELENVLERGVLFTEGSTLRVADLPAELRAEPLSSSEAIAPIAEAPAPPASGSLKDLVRRETDRVERELIQRALDETNGNVTQAARRLKISRKSLQTKMKEFGLRDRE